MRRDELTRVIGARFQSTDMAHYVLGRNRWQQLSDDERGEFVRLFQWLLVMIYTRHIDRHAQYTPLYVDEFFDPDQAVVHAWLVYSHRELPLDFRLVQQAGTWHVYDMILDGMSLIQNYRAQFAHLLQISSYSNAINRLRDIVCVPACDEALRSDNVPAE
jgi:phospholipid transport system substrate-binding protein